MRDWRSEIRKTLEPLGLDPSKESEIVEELNQHLTDRYQELLNSGMASHQAEIAVREELNAKKLAAEMRISISSARQTGISEDRRVLGGLGSDFRLGLRLLRLNPGFALVAVFSLMLGIGANTAIFQIINAVRLRSLPVHQPEQLALVRIVKTPKGRTGAFYGRSPNLTTAQWERIREQQQGFSHMAVWHAGRRNLNQGGEARYADVLMVSGSFFDTLGVQPALGRLIGEADDVSGCGSSAAVLSDAFWHREYGGSPAVLGQKITLSRQPFEITGVAPPGFSGLETGRSFDVAIPQCTEHLFSPEQPKASSLRNWWLAAIGRLKPEWTIEEASAQLAAISPGIFEETIPPEYDAVDRKNYLQFVLGAVPAGKGVNSTSREYERPLMMLMGIAALVLLIACANLANLMMARAGARQREMAVRLALGASRLRLIRQLLVESFLLVALGAACGAVLAQGLSRVLISSFTTQEMTLFLDLQIDWRILLFTAGIAVLTCILLGLAPAIFASRTSPGEVMKASSRNVTTGHERFEFRRLLVVSQVALSLVLLFGALLFVRTFQNLMNQNTGFSQKDLLVTHVDFSTNNLPVEDRLAHRNELLERFRAIPGVISAAEVALVPVNGSFWNNNISIPGTTVIRQIANFNMVGPQYFRTMETPLVYGRDFDERDTKASTPVAIVTETYSRKFLNGSDPVGSTLTVPQQGSEPEHVFQVIGMVKDAKYTSLREEFSPMVFLPAAQDPEPQPEANYIIRTRGQTAPMAVSVQHVISGFNPSIVIRFQVFETILREGLLRERLMAALSGSFAFLATLLAMIGLYGVISYMVIRRRNEIGIRIALGADTRAILTLILREASMLVIAGVALGVLLVLITGSAARALLYGLSPNDPLTLVFAVAGLAAIAAIASSLPAHRAASVDPAEALREE